MIFAVAYVAIIVTVNVLFGMGTWWPNVATVLVGLGFVIRDHAQAKMGDKVLYATALGVGISFVMASPGVAVPSAVAFALSETADWAVVRRLITRPMWQRVLYSHLVSVPLDSAVFLLGLVWGIGVPWSWPMFAQMVGLKMLALGFIWWRR